MYETLAGWYVPLLAAGGAFAFGAVQAGSTGKNLFARSCCGTPASGWPVVLGGSDSRLTLRAGGGVDAVDAPNNKCCLGMPAASTFLVALSSVIMYYYVLRGYKQWQELKVVRR
jgi:hypothetical protein